MGHRIDHWPGFGRISCNMKKERFLFNISLNKVSIWPRRKRGFCFVLSFVTWKRVKSMMNSLPSRHCVKKWERGPTTFSIFSCSSIYKKNHLGNKKKTAFKWKNENGSIMYEKWKKQFIYVVKIPQIWVYISY